VPLAQNGSSSEEMAESSHEMEDFEEIETEEVTNYAEIMPAFVDHNPIENTVHSNDQTTVR
jgi:hypothetical protein